jgi:hypothetical protein
MNLNTPLEFGGAVYAGSIYVSPKGTITFGQGDYTFWDYPATPSISIGSWDYHAFPNTTASDGWNPGWGIGNDLYVRYGSTATSICVDWKVLPWGQTSGNPVYIRMLAEVNPVNYTWTPTYQVSSSAPAGARYGVRYTQNGEVFPLEIQTISEPPAPSPTPSPKETVEPSLEPTPEVIVPSPVPSQTPDPEPTTSVEPTLNPEPTPVPEPTQSTTPTPGPQQSQQPEPTLEPSQQPSQPAPQPSETSAVPVKPSITPTPSLSPSGSPLQPAVPPATQSPTPEPQTSSPTPEVPTPVESPTPDPSFPATLPQDNTITPELIVLDNGVVIEQEVAEALEVLNSFDSLVAGIFNDPGQVILAIQNIGADMSPEVRKDAQVVVVATIVVTQIIGAAVSQVLQRR